MVVNTFPSGGEPSLQFLSFLFNLSDEILTHLRLIPAGAMRLIQFLQEGANVALFLRDGIKYWIGGRLHGDILMPGMIVLAYDSEEAFLDLHLPGDEEQAIGEMGADLLINFLNS